MKEAGAQGGKVNQSGALVTGSGSGLMDGGRSDGETWARRAADLKVSYGLGSGGILLLEEPSMLSEYANPELSLDRAF